MSLEVISTAAAIGTFVVIAATAVAALIQLRHMRSSNQIEAQLAINALIQSDEFRNAEMVLEGLPEMIADPAIAWAFRGRVTATLPPQVIEMRKAARLVGSNLENIGNMIRNRLTDQRLFIEQFGNTVSQAWDLLEPLTRVRRKFMKEHDAIWEDFEYLTILSREWMQTQGSAFPKNRRRLLPPWTDLEIPQAVMAGIHTDPPSETGSRYVHLHHQKQEPQT